MGGGKIGKAKTPPEVVMKYFSNSCFYSFFLVVDKKKEQKTRNVKWEWPTYIPAPDFTSIAVIVLYLTEVHVQKCRCFSVLMQSWHTVLSRRAHFVTCRVSLHCVPLCNHVYVCRVCAQCVWLGLHTVHVHIPAHRTHIKSSTFTAFPPLPPVTAQYFQLHMSSAAT